MPGHVLHGWRDLSEGDRKRLAKGEGVRGWPHDESLADGHRWDSTRKGASTFPKEWTDQKIVDSVRDTLENPDVGVSWSNLRIVRKEIDGQTIEMKYASFGARGVKFISAYTVVRR